MYSIGDTTELSEGALGGENDLWNSEQEDKKFFFQKISARRVIAVLLARDDEVMAEIEDLLLKRGWTESDSEVLIDNLEEWRLTQPLTEEQEEEIPPGMTDRVYDKLLSMISETHIQEDS